MSKPFNYFDASMTRSKRMMIVAESSGDAADDVARGALVIAVAAYDHYFTSKFCDVLNSYLKNNQPNKELINLLDRAGLRTEAALEIAVMKRPFRRIRALLSLSLGEKTTNRTKAIDNLFAAIDLPGISGRVEKNLSRKNICKRINKLVDIRNEISHSAHLNSHGKPKAIDRADILARINEIELFVSECELVINGWVKSRKLPSVISTA